MTNDKQLGNRFRHYLSLEAKTWEERGILPSLGVDRGFAWEESMVLSFKAFFKGGSLLLKPH
jgi:hypothetical protein